MYKMVLYFHISKIPANHSSELYFDTLCKDVNKTKLQVKNLFRFKMPS